MAALEEHVEPYDGSKLIEKIQKRIETNEKFFSLEFFTPYTFSGACNLLEKCQRLSEGKPLFYDVTFNSKNLHLQVASSTQNITKCHTMIQLSSSSLSEESALLLLNDAKRFGLSTVMVIDGGY